MSSEAHLTSEQQDTSLEQQQQQSPTQSWTLFVGQIPNDVNEESLKHLFSTYGLVTESKILFDKAAGKPKGCGFITYADKHGAEIAIATLHEKYTLPGSSRPIICRYSTKQLAAEKCEAGPFKLYISNLSKQTTEDELRNLFAQYGELVDDVVILRDQHTNQSKGVAFVRYNTRVEASNAINALNEQIRDKDATNLLQVKFAHTTNEKRQLAKNGIITPNYAQSMGASAYPVAMHSAAALTQQQQHAAAAQAQLGGYYTPATASHQLYSPQYSAQYNPYAISHQPVHYQPQQHAYAQPHHPQHHQPHHPHQKSHQQGGATKGTYGPDGANLFVYGIPESYDENDLQSMFNQFGHVINSKVYREPQTGKSKGFGFISYDTLPAAQQACQHMDGYLVAGRKLTVKPKGDNGQSSSSSSAQSTQKYYQQHQQQQSHQQPQQSHHQQNGHTQNGHLEQSQQQQLQNSSPQRGQNPQSLNAIHQRTDPNAPQQSNGTRTGYQAY